MESACHNPRVRVLKDDGSPHEELGVRKLRDFREWASGVFMGPHRQKVGNFVPSDAAVARNPLKGNFLSFVLKLYLISRVTDNARSVARSSPSSSVKTDLESLRTTRRGPRAQPTRISQRASRMADNSAVVGDAW